MKQKHKLEEQSKALEKLLASMSKEELEEIVKKIDAKDGDGPTLEEYFLNIYG